MSGVARRFMPGFPSGFEGLASCWRTEQRDPPQYGGRDRSGRGEWRPVGREGAPVTPGPNTPDGGHATDSKEPLRHTLKLPPQTSGTSDLPGPSSAERTREPSTCSLLSQFGGTRDQAKYEGVARAGPARVTAPIRVGGQAVPAARTDCVPAAMAGPVASLARPVRCARCCTGEVEGSRKTTFLLHPVRTARGPGGWTPGPLFWAVPPTGENDP